MSTDTAPTALLAARAAQRAYTKHVTDPAATCRCASGGQCREARRLEIEIEAAYARSDAELEARPA